MNELEKSRSQEIARLHMEIIGHLRQSLEKAIRTGELLMEQKASLKHGAWEGWIEQNLPFIDRTAQNYMCLYAERGRIKTGNISDLRRVWINTSDLDSSIEFVGFVVG